MTIWVVYLLVWGYFTSTVYANWCHGKPFMNRTRAVRPVMSGSADSCACVVLHSSFDAEGGDPCVAAKNRGGRQCTGGIAGIIISR